MAANMDRLQQIRLEALRRQAEIQLEQMGVGTGEQKPTGKAENAPPLLGVVTGDNNLTTGERTRLGAAMVLNATEAGIADTIQKIRPDTKVESDPHGNLIVEFGPSAGDHAGDRYSINPEGVDMTDIVRFAGAATLAIPAAKFGSAAATGIRRVIRTGLAEGATSIGMDLGAKALGSNQSVSLERAVEAAVIGGAFEWAARPLVAAIKGIIRTPMFFRNGQLTKRGLKAARAAGLDPDTLNTTLAREFAKQRARGMPNAAAAGVAMSREFNVPLTRGQAADNLAQQQTEQVLRNVGGDRAEAIMEGFDARQAEKIAQSADREAAAVSGGDRKLTVPRDVSEVGAIQRAGIVREAEALQKRVDAAFSEARLQESGFHGKDLGALFKGIKEAAQEFPLDKELTPRAMVALKQLRDFEKRIRFTSANRAKGGIMQATDFAQFDLARRKLGKLIDSAKDPVDRAYVTIIKHQLDNFVDDAFTNGLFKGDAKTLEFWKKARALRTEFGKQFEPQNRNDTVGKIMQTLIKTDPTGKEATNLILGLGKIGGGGKTVAAKVVERLRTVLGPDSHEFGALREDVFLRIVGEGKDLTTAKVQSNIFAALKNDRELMKSLFTKEQIYRLKNFGSLMRRVEIPEQARNPSRTAFMQTTIAQTLGRIVGSAMMPVHTLIGQSIGARVGRTLFGRAFGKEGAAAIESTSPFPPPPASAVVGGAVAGDRVSGDKIDLEKMREFAPF